MKLIFLGMILLAVMPPTLLGLISKHVLKKSFGTGFLLGIALVLFFTLAWVGLYLIVGGSLSLLKCTVTL
jgi:hypothetical protein